MSVATRRAFLATSLSAAASTFAQDAGAPEPVIDIHQHTNYRGRDDAHRVHRREHDRRKPQP